MVLPAAAPVRAGDGSALRTPPQAPEMERALLGALLLDGSTFAQVGDLLDDFSFYRPANGIIFSAMKQLDAHHERLIRSPCPNNCVSRIGWRRLAACRPCWI